MVTGNGAANVCSQCVQSMCAVNKANDDNTSGMFILCQQKHVLHLFHNSIFDSKAATNTKKTISPTYDTQRDEDHLFYIPNMMLYAAISNMMLYAAISTRAKGEPPTRHQPIESNIFIKKLSVGPYSGSMVQSATDRASSEDIADATADTEVNNIILHNTVAHERSEQANTEAKHHKHYKTFFKTIKIANFQRNLNTHKSIQCIF